MLPPTAQETGSIRLLEREREWEVCRRGGGVEVNWRLQDISVSVQASSEGEGRLLGYSHCVSAISISDKVSDAEKVKDS